MDNELEKVEVIARVTWRRRLAFFCGIAGHDGRVDDFGAHARMEAAIIVIL
jgi:hypothetical protein